jgi:ElaA protein
VEVLDLPVELALSHAHRPSGHSTPRAARRFPLHDNGEVTRIRVAAFDELDSRTAYLLWQLREQVFVVEQECPYLDLDGRDLEPGTRHLWAEEDGRPVAYLRVLEDTGDAEGTEGTRIGRVLVDGGRRGRGLAKRLMEAALDVVGGRPCRLDAQSYLVEWYRGLGFEPSGHEFVEDGIPHVPMRLAQSSRSRA